jgi:hypothetical protein
MCFITEQYEMMNPVMYKHPLAKLNTKIAIIRLTILQRLQMIRIETFVMYGSLYPRCEFTKSITHLSNTFRWGSLYAVQYALFCSSGSSCYSWLRRTIVVSGV